MLPEDPPRIGKYQILRLRGRGGMSSVYEALDTDLGRRIALKVLSGQSPQLVARLHREAHAAARLRHPNIVAVYDVGFEGDAHYIAMELVDGPTLADARPTLTRRARLEALEKIALAVAHAHQNGIVHRDLKPQNVLVEAATGRLFLGDFGLAKTLDGENLTRTGSAVGTPQYMAPEQIRGESARIGPHTDVWALGVLLYEFVGDRHPFPARTTSDLFTQILSHDPLPLRNADRDLHTICFKALEKDHRRRYATATEFAADLRRALDGEPVLARRASPLARFTRRVRTHPAPFVAVLVAVLGALVLLTLQSIRARATAQDSVRRARVIFDSLDADRRAAVDQLIKADELLRAGAPFGRDLRYDVNRRLGELALAGGDYGLARLAFGVCESLRPGDPLPRVEDHEQAEARRRASRIRAAIDDLERGLARPDRAAGAPLLEDYVFEVVGYRDDQTVRLLAEALEPLALKSPWSNEERDLMKFAFRVLGRIDRPGAVGPLGRMMRRLDNDEDLAAECGEALCNTRHPSALEALIEARGRLPYESRAWIRISRLMARVPNLESATGLQSSEDFFHRGLSRYEFGDFDGAIADYTRAMELAPANSIIVSNRGTAREAKGDVAGAIADFTRAIEMEPHNPIVWVNRGGLYRQTGDLDASLTDLTRAVELDPASARAREGRALTRYVRRDYAGAIEDCTRAIERDPRRSCAYSSRSLARRDHGDIKGAIADAIRAVELDPRDPRSHGSLAQARQASGDLRGAIEDYTRALELNPRYAIALYNRAAARRDSGDLAGAIADWERFLEIEPGHPRAGAVRERIAQAREGLKK